MLSIRDVVAPEDLDRVYAFRYRVAVEEMRRPQRYADHERRRITDPLDLPSARIVAAWDDDAVVGTVRNNFLRTCDVGEYRHHYALDTLDAGSASQTSITTRLMVAPAYRGTPLALRLAREAYRGGLARGIAHDFIDCNAHLVRFFLGLGYYVHRHDLVHPEYGAVRVMRLDLTDRAALETARSPLLDLLDAAAAA